MLVTTDQITSSSSPDDNLPWYDLSISDGVLTIDNDGDGGTNTDLGGESVSIITDSDSVVAVSSDGELIAFPAGESKELRAHLARFDSDADELTVLEFVEE